MIPAPPPPPPPPGTPGGYGSQYGYRPIPPPSQTSGLAIASMVLGVVSVILWWLWGIVSLITGILAIVFAVRSPRNQFGRRPGMATAGLVTGIIGCVFGSLFIVLLIAVAASGNW